MINGDDHGTAQAVFTFKVLRRRIGRRAGRQSRSLWTCLQNRQMVYLILTWVPSCLACSPLELLIPVVKRWTRRRFYVSESLPDTPWAESSAGWSGSRWRSAVGPLRCSHAQRATEQRVGGTAWTAAARPCYCIAQMPWPHPAGWAQCTCTDILRDEMDTKDKTIWNN